MRSILQHMGSNIAISLLAKHLLIPYGYCMCVFVHVRGCDWGRETDTLTICFQRNLSSFLTDGGHHETVQIICAGYWLYQQIHQSCVFVLDPTIVLCSDKYRTEKDGDYKMHYFWMQPICLFVFFYFLFAGSWMKLSNLPTTLSLKGQKKKTTTKTNCRGLLKKVTMPMCKVPCTFKSTLIDNNFDKITDCVGCLTWMPFSFSTFCGWLVSQEDAATTSNRFYFPCA